MTATIPSTILPTAKVRRPSILRRITLPVTTAITRLLLNRCRTSVALDLATTREHLADAEESYRCDGPFAHDGLAREIVELRRREEGLLEELAYVQFKLDALAERECAAACSAA